MGNGFVIRKAERSQVKIRVALIGPSGSGKTYSALRLAKGLAPGGLVVLIDTEHRRADYYADEFSFSKIDIAPPFAPERYIQAIEAAEEAGAEVIIVDSGSHEWNGKGGILQIKDAMPGANDYVKWAVLTPRHDAFVDKLIRCKPHLIVNLRGKDEYVLEANERGKQAPKKVGVGAQMRDGLEYEMTCSLLLDLEKHIASPMKDNTHIFENKYEVLTEAHGAALLAWCESGAAIPLELPSKREIARELVADPERVPGDYPPGRVPFEPEPDAVERGVQAALEQGARRPAGGNGKPKTKRQEIIEQIAAVMKHPLFSDAERAVVREDIPRCKSEGALASMLKWWETVLEIYKVAGESVFDEATRKKILGEVGAAKQFSDLDTTLKWWLRALADKTAPAEEPEHDSTAAAEVQAQQANAELASEGEYNAAADGAQDLFGEPVGAGTAQAAGNKPAADGETF
jgi:hypothetical protein